MVTKDSDEDDRPIAQTLETTQKTHVHRKDNSEWGKRMEKQLSEMDRRREETDQTNPTVEIATAFDKGQTPLLGKRRSVFRRLNTVLDNTEGSDGRLKQSSQIGKTVARDFGDAGVFEGEIVQVEYDSEDIDKVEPIYVVEYTDGDREDMDADEMQYAHELHLRRLCVDVGNESAASGSNEEESYRPSPPKVNLNLCDCLLQYLSSLHNKSRLGKKKAQKRQAACCQFLLFRKRFTKA